MRTSDASGAAHVRQSQSKGAQSGPQPVKIRLHPDVRERAKYWAQKHGYTSVNEYMASAVEEKIARENGDYDLPALEIQRLNQLLDQMASMSTNVMNLETVVVSGFDSLLGLTRGDAYLLDAEDGELDTSGAGLGAGFAGTNFPDEPNDDSVAANTYGGF